MDENAWQPSNIVRVLDATEVPDYSDSVTKATFLQCGAFVYDNISSSQVLVHRRGPVELENGAIYIGEWNESQQRHGRGEQMGRDGSKYEGSWSFDKASGKGRLIHANGDVYTGDWLESKAHGFGVLLQTDGSKYEGEWKDDKMDGRGVRTWPDGRRYEGAWFNGKQHGKGTYTTANGQVREGEWKDGKRIKWLEEDANDS